MASEKITKLEAILNSEDVFVSSENGEVIEEAINLLKSGREDDAAELISNLLDDDDAEVPMELGDELSTIF